MYRRHIKSRYATVRAFIARRSLSQRLNDLPADKHKSGPGIIYLYWTLELIQVLDQLPVLPRRKPLLVAKLHGVASELDIGVKPHHVRVFGGKKRSRHLIAGTGNKAFVGAYQPVVANAQIGQIFL